MKRFLTKAGAFAVLQLVVFAVLLARSGNRAATDYYAATLDKHSRAQSINGPRILIVGGSNTAFGIDSPSLERTLGRPVVNLGIHAGVGLEFLLNEAQSEIRPGDVVVITPEYEHFLADNTSPPVVFRFIEHRPEAVRYLGWNSASKLLDAGLPFIHEITRRGLKRRREPSASGHRTKPASDPYFRDAFNNHGDVVAHHQMTPVYKESLRAGAQHVLRKPTEDSPFPERAMSRAIDQIQQFVLDCRRSQVQVFLAHPPLSRSFAESIRTKIARIDDACRNRLDVPVLTRWEELVFDDGQFFDSCYHLTEAGKRNRTKGLADALLTELPDSLRVEAPGTPSIQTATPENQSTRR